MILFVLSLLYLSSLGFKNLQRSDAGEYSCHIVNEMGEGTSEQPFMLDIYCKFSEEMLLWNIINQFN